MNNEFKDVQGNRVGWITETDIKDTYGNRVGWITETDIKDTYGNRVGYSGGSDIKDTYGNRVGYISGNEIRDTNGNRIGYSVGSATNEEMIAAALLLFKLKSTNNNINRNEEEKPKYDSYEKEEITISNSNLNIFDNDDFTHNFFESVRNSQIDAQIRKERKYWEEQQKMKEAVYQKAINKINSHDKDGAIIELSNYLENDYDCTRISNDQIFNSIRENCNELIRKYEEKKEQSRLWKEAGLCSSCGNKLKVKFDKDYYGNESWTYRMRSRACKSCGKIGHVYNSSDPEMKKISRIWLLTEVIISIISYLLLCKISFRYIFYFSWDYLSYVLSYALLDNVYTIIPFVIIFFTPWVNFGFWKYVRITLIIIQVIISIVMIFSNINLTIIIIIPIIIGSILMNISCIMAYKEPLIKKK